MLSFKPSQVVLFVPPLVGTMKRAEYEQAAALVVRVCQSRGDEWKPVRWPEVQAVLREDLEAKTEFSKLLSNPFFRPDVRGMAAAGFATFEDGGVEFTEKGLEALLRWVRPTEGASL